MSAWNAPRFSAGLAIVSLFCTLGSHGAESSALATNDVTTAYLREFYTKFEYKIPMRDGVKLLTAVFAPKDDSTPYPILLTRTPYSLRPYRG